MPPSPSRRPTLRFLVLSTTLGSCIIACSGSASNRPAETFLSVEVDPESHAFHVMTSSVAYEPVPTSISGSGSLSGGHSPTCALAAAHACLSFLSAKRAIVADEAALGRTWSAAWASFPSDCLPGGHPGSGRPVSELLDHAGVRECRLDTVHYGSPDAPKDPFGQAGEPCALCETATVRHESSDGNTQLRIESTIRIADALSLGGQVVHEGPVDKDLFWLGADLALLCGHHNDQALSTFEGHYLLARVYARYAIALRDGAPPVFLPPATFLPADILPVRDEACESGSQLGWMSSTLTE